MTISVYQQGGYGTAPLFPQPIIADRDPATTDRVDPSGAPYGILQGWNNRLTDDTFIYLGAGNWVTVASVVGSLNELTGDSGTALPVTGNINILGGTNITTVGASPTGDDLSVNLDAAISLATSVTSPLYLAPAATDMDITATLGQDLDITLGDAAGANNVSFFDSTPTLRTSLDSVGTFTSQGDMITSRSDSGVNVTHQITNSDNTSLTSNSQLEIATGGASSGDSGVVYQVSGVATNWFAGLDNSDSDAWVLSASATAGTSNAMRIDHTTQDVQFYGDVDLVAGDLTVNGSITSDSFIENSTSITLSQSPILQSTATTGAAPTGATGDVNLMSLQDGEIMEQFILGAGQTIIAPRMSSAGLLTSLDLINAEGAEYNWGMRDNADPTFVIGTSPAFYFQLEVTAADIGGLDPFLAGFRIVQANDATLANYTDFAAIGASATDAADVIYLKTQLNTGGVTTTSTTDAWTDGQTKIFRINISGTGVVTYLINGAPPTATAAFTFDTGDRVAPFIRHLFGAATPGAIDWVSFSYGLQ